MIKIHKILKDIYPIYFKKQKTIFFDRNNSSLGSINNFRFLSTTKIYNFNFSLTSCNYNNNKFLNQQQQQQQQQKQNQNRNVRDEGIKSKYIKYVNLKGQLQGTYPLEEILLSFDRTKYWLVQVSPEQKEKIPVCKLVSKQELYKQVKQKKSTHSQIIKKELKLTWGVSPNDLTHKLSKSKEWLKKGSLLRVIITNKGKKSHNQDKSILDKINKELSEFSKDIKEPKWVGSSVTIEIQGKKVSEALEASEQS